MNPAITFSSFNEVSWPWVCLIIKGTKHRGVSCRALNFSGLVSKRHLTGPEKAYVNILQYSFLGKSNKSGSRYVYICIYISCAFLLSARSGGSTEKVCAGSQHPREAATSSPWISSCAGAGAGVTRAKFSN